MTSRGDEKNVDFDESNHNLNFFETILIQNSFVEIPKKYRHMYQIEYNSWKLCQQRPN